MKNEKYPKIPLTPLERDLENITTKGYTLSIGRFYQVISLVRGHESLPYLGTHLVDFWKSHDYTLLEVLISDEFFLPFSQLMEREIFSKKRHEKKVSFADAKIVRNHIFSLLRCILEII